MTTVYQHHNPVVEFLMVLTSDHITGATGKSPSVTLSKNGAAFAPASNGASEVGNGIYKITLTPAEVDTLGQITLHATAADSDPTDLVISVVQSPKLAAYHGRFPGYRNIWFVDGNSGDPTYNGRSLEFALDTLTAAQTAASSGDLIIVLPATYSEDTLGKDGVDWYFHHGAIISNLSSGLTDDVFTDSAGPASFRVLGEVQINIANGDVLHIMEDAAEIVFEFSRITTTAGRGFAMEGESRQYLKGNSLHTVNGSIDQFNAAAETWFDIKEIQSVGFCLENDGGKIIGRSERLVSSASSAIDMATLTGLTAVDVQYVSGANDAAVNHGNETATLVIRGAMIDGPVDGAITMQANSVVHLVGCSINGTITGGTPVYSNDNQFPANFPNLGINGSGHLLRVVENDDAVTVDAIEAALVNDGDATALLQAIADKIAADLTAGDLSALAIVQAIKNDTTLAQMIARIDADITSRSSHAAADVTAHMDANSTKLTAIDNKTGNLPADPASVTNQTAISNAIAALQLVADAVQLKTDNLPADPATVANQAAIAAAIAAIESSTDIANAVEAALLNDGDGQQFLNAINTIVQQLFDTDTDVPVATLVNLVTAEVLAGIASAHGAGSYEPLPDRMLILETTISNVVSQTVIDLTDASPGDDVYNGFLVLLADAATMDQKSAVWASDYDSDFQRLTLESAPSFTVVAGDTVCILAIPKPPESSGGGPGTGSGPNSVTITVTDGTDPLQNATVLLDDGGVNQYQGLTAADGTIELNTVSATFDVLIAKDGFQFSGTTLVVDGTEAETYVMTALTISPTADNETVTAYFYTRNESGVITGVDCSATCTCAPDGTGSAFVPEHQSGSSNGTGLFSFAAWKGGCYKVTVAGVSYKVNIPSNADDPFAIDNQLIRQG